MNNSSSSRSELVNRAEYVLSAMLALCAFCLLSLPMFGQLFCRKLLALKGGMASSLVVYQSTQLIFLSTSLAYNFYMLFAWLFQAAQFNVFLMFWTGLWPLAITLTISSATFFLTLDRCFVLLWPIGYPNRRPQRMVMAMNVGTGIAIFLGAVIQTICQEMPLDLGQGKIFLKILTFLAAHCLNHPCVATKGHYKYIVLFLTAQGIINLAISLCFFLLLRRKTAMLQQQSGVAKISFTRNKIVGITIIFEIFFKILPSLICSLVNNLTIILISDYLGWYLLLFTSIDSFAISIFYALVLLKKPNILCFAQSNEGVSKMSANVHQLKWHQVTSAAKAQNQQKAIKMTPVLSI